MKKINIVGNNIILKKFKKNLVNKNYLDWFSEKKNYKYIKNSNKTMSYIYLRKYVRKNLNNKKVIFLSIFFKKNNQHIGNVRLFKNGNQKIQFSILIGDKKYRNRGLGTEILNICSDYIFKKLKKQIILAEVISENKAAVKIYQKCGFEISKIYFKNFKNIKTKFYLMKKNNKEIVENIDFIPARKGSVGFKNKNQILFKYTSKFLKNNDLFQKIFVSTNDNKIKKFAKKNNFEVHNRRNFFSGNKTSIKKTLINFVKEQKISKDSIIWLFYIPIVYKNILDFKKAKKITMKKNFKSLCSFKKVNISPYNCWVRKKRKMAQYIKNDFYRRQDLPETFIHYHYLCAFKTQHLNKLNSELISKHTIPVILDKNTSSKLIEIDTKHDYNFLKKNKYLK